VGNGECGAMGRMERLCRGTVGEHWFMWRFVQFRASMERAIWWALVNVALWDVSSCYVDGQLVGTGKCGGMSCNERLWKGTFIGDW